MAKLVHSSLVASVVLVTAAFVGCGGDDSSNGDSGGSGGDGNGTLTTGTNGTGTGSTTTGSDTQNITGTNTTTGSSATFAANDIPAICANDPILPGAAVIETFDAPGTPWTGANTNTAFIAGRYWSTWRGDGARKPTDIGDTPSTPGANSSAGAFTVTGGEESLLAGQYPYAGTSLTLGSETSRCPMDLSAYVGISFYYKSATPVYFTLPTVKTIGTANGGLCTAKCYNHWGKLLPAADTWTQVKLVWDSAVTVPGGVALDQSWSETTAVFSPAEVFQINMQVKDANALAAYSFSLDELELIEGPASSTGGTSGTTAAGGAG